MHKKNIVLLFCAFIIFSFCRAQDFEIRSVNQGNGIIGVQLRQTSGQAVQPGDIVTDIVFGLKWKTSYQVDLLNNITSVYNIKKSGDRTVKGDHYFQAFYAFNTPFNIPAGWVLNEWVEIMRIENTRNSIGEGEFEICDAGFDVTCNPNIGINLTDYTPLINGTATGVTLPVSFLNFDVLNKGKSLLAVWSVTNEINNKGFELERSDGNASSFKTINSVDSKATAGSASAVNEYLYNDTKIMYGVTYYYRVKQLDKDGRYDYSAIRIGKTLNGKNNKFSLSPNPAKNLLRVSFKTITGENSMLKILDVKGAVLLQRRLSAVTGQSLELNISSFTSGMYFVSLYENSDLSGVESFVKE